mmetsp:Transcript_14675/g.22092  ORF Transcript_14675/g.22092 Transcript_14675/m.22092 type:complete len:129 (+) Transcript_14675:82-468(+)|eukprot:scaffold3039_cov117-Skeletonema_dohrnii-CCMP3373.AAC.10
MMQRILFFSLTALVVAVPQHVAAFSTNSLPSISRAAYDVPRTKVALQQSPENAIAEDTDDVTCFIVNDEEIITEGEKPHVVCTSEPDDYAWFNGVDPENMRETDGVIEGAENCVQGESFKGKPEWECE